MKVQGWPNLRDAKLFVCRKIRPIIVGILSAKLSSPTGDRTSCLPQVGSRH
jgi:hypothetical protein